MTTPFKLSENMGDDFFRHFLGHEDLPFKVVFFYVLGYWYFTSANIYFDLSSFMDFIPLDNGSNSWLWLLYLSLS